MENPRKRGGIYSRRSVLDDRHGRSVSEQQEAGRADFDTYGWDLAETYEDDGKSASRFATKTRDDWLRALADIDACRLDVLWLWEPSRGDRKLTEWAGFLDLCRDRGVLLHIGSHGRTYEPANARDRRTLAEDGVDSEYESEKTSKRVRRALAANAVNGVPHGNVPYGYRRTYHPKSGILIGQEADPDQAPIVAEIAARVANSEPIITITKDLNTRGVPSPAGRQWTRAVVRRIATHDRYVARRTYQGQVFAGQWPALIDEATFAAARRVLSDPSRKTTRPGRQKWLLSYFATCGQTVNEDGKVDPHGTICGAALCAIPAHSHHSTPGYRCSTTGGHVQVNQPGMDDLIEDLVCHRLAKPDIYELVAAPDDSVILTAREEATALKEQLNGYYDAAARKELSPAGLIAMEQRLLPQLADAEHRAMTIAVPRALRDMITPGMSIADVHARWKDRTIPAKRDILRALFIDIIVLPHPNRGQKGPDVPPARVRPTWRTYRTADPHP
ncbi:recombinase family protein [Frankia sp. Cas4]|uniref:recombinase family protein n=1 Tax=Frankia sp. Cas4 TaxID=3073927 RepID=UPI002AD4B2FC|nr:recombinase family protein [Frankia sp. Cas4]